MDCALTKTRFKDSGSQWLGKIPESWGLKKLKFLVSCVGGGTPSTGTPEFWGGDIPWVSPKDMKCASIKSTEDYLTELGVVSSATSLINVGAVLVVVRSGILRHSIPVARNAVQVALNQDMKALIPKGALTSSFLYWIIEGNQSQLLPLWSKPGCTVESIELGYLLNTEIPLPSADEQETIVRFLDYKTGQIDALIAKKEALLARLAEKRIALLSHAVTKGLDPSALMKDSGVAWLGEIPAHWVMTRLRFLALGIEQGWSPQCNNQQAAIEQWGVLKVGCVNGEAFDENENKALPDDLEPRTQYQVRDGDILVSRANTKELLGSAALVRDVRAKLLLCDKLYRITPNESVNPDYLVRFLRSSIARFQYERNATGASGSMQNIGQDTLKDLPIPLPPKSEQDRIAEYLHGVFNNTSAIESRVQGVINKLKEYRSSLITNAVTGKIDVRQFALPTTGQEAAHA
ncbi:restriction endonuclease subunit S [Desulfobulbus sp.]|uniref:restriction endonuclease subunit S n=1 Tax=Desulfobulbus sp. TaxID=895 RepID=UPI0027B9BD7C|nr:restriction endonuclease subunit S [Desulfobulbus sp.]